MLSKDQATRLACEDYFKAVGCYAQAAVAGLFFTTLMTLEPPSAAIASTRLINEKPSKGFSSALQSANRQAFDPFERWTASDPDASSEYSLSSDRDKLEAIAAFGSATAQQITDATAPSQSATALSQSLEEQSQLSSREAMPMANRPEAIAADAELEQLRRQLLIEPLPRLVQTPISSPALTLSTPTAFGANFGDLFAGLSFVNRPREGSGADGSAVVGFGLGNSRRYAGLEVAVSIISLSTSGGRDQIGGSGAVGFKLHRQLPGGWGIAAGWEQAVTWGDAGQEPSSVYGVVSKVFFLQRGIVENPMPLVLSVGVGGGRFRSVSAIESGDASVGMFASAGLQFAPQFSAIANWTGQDLNLGLSIVPFRRIPLVVTLSAADIIGNAGDGVRYAFSVGYGFSFTGR